MVLSSSKTIVFIHLCIYFTALLNASEYLVQVTLALSNLEYLQTVLNTFSFPVMINNVTDINSINTTTGTSATLYCFHIVRCLSAAVKQYSFFTSV